jgi:hypothetical protein
MTSGLLAFWIVTKEHSKTARPGTDVSEFVEETSSPDALSDEVSCHKIDGNSVLSDKRFQRGGHESEIEAAGVYVLIPSSIFGTHLNSQTPNSTKVNKKRYPENTQTTRRT